MPMNAHNIRVEDNLWTRAGKRAADEDTNLSTLIRTWLTDYAAGGEANAERAKVRLSAGERKALHDRLTQINLDVVDIAIDTINKER